MKDFTLRQYERYLRAIINAGIPFYRYDEFLEQNIHTNQKYCLVRHDVDRKPKLSLDMAKLEHQLGIKSTYYFRIKSCSFKPEIMKGIAALGHEIGYHYETLSDTDGDADQAFELFKSNLQKFKAICPIKTCSMHGRPFKPYDNRDIWKHKDYHAKLKADLGLLGEVYLDIDYSGIAYINDTGRNWTSGKSNVRDKVDSKIAADFESGEDLLNYLKNPHPKMVFQIHPERWSDDFLTWQIQSKKDVAINTIKKVLSYLR